MCIRDSAGVARLPGRFPGAVTSLPVSQQSAAVVALKLVTAARYGGGAAAAAAAEWHGSVLDASLLGGRCDDV